jgi:hypothetical protein
MTVLAGSRCYTGVMAFSSDMDLGLIFGLVGFVTAVLSALYARAQAVEARRQAEAAHLAAAIELNRSMNEHMLQARMGIIRSPLLMREYVAVNPALAAIYGDQEKAEAFIHLRNFLDGFQDMYFLRKQGILLDHQWRQWKAALAPAARMPTFKVIYENAVQRQAVEPEFAAFVQPLFEGKELGDPKAQIMR